MKSLHVGLTALGAFFLSLSAAQAQVPVLDGVISPGEYGSSYTSGDQTWYMTWNNDNLYVATTGAPVSEATVMYFDTNPSLIVNDVNSPGTTQGFSYDGTNGNLPFKADAVLYFKPGSQYREVRKYDAELGRWGDLKTGVGADKTNGNTIREFFIPWSEISTTGTRPANFNWLGYITYNNPGGIGVYAPAPRTNPSGAIGTNAALVRYFTTLNTAATGSNNNAFGPNGLDSYTHVGNSIDGFGDLSVYDFTLNTPGASIVRRSANSTWSIANNLRIGGGSLNLGDASDLVSIGGNLEVLGSSGIFRYSTPGGSLAVGGNLQFPSPASFDVTAGLTLNGNGNQIISADTYRILNIQGTGNKTLTGGNIVIQSALNIDGGTLITPGSSLVRLEQDANFAETGTGYLLGTIQATANVNGPGNSYDFGGIGLALTPLTNNDLLNGVTVQRITGGFGVDGSTADPTANKTIRRRFFINAANQQPVNARVDFTYRTANPSELEGNMPANLALYKSGSRTGFYSPVTGGTKQTAENTFSYTGPIAFNAAYFSLNDGTQPLPVELISFTGRAENSTARLTWATASEKQNKGFEVERRTDQSEWQTLSFVAGNGTTNQRHNYSYVDRAPVAGNNYYRLRQIDLDGKSVYSDPLTVQVGAVEFTLSPVPATDVLTFNGLGAGQHTAEIYNSRGQRVLSKEFSADAATTVAVNSLPAGVYMVRVVGADRSTRNARFIKE